MNIHWIEQAEQIGVRLTAVQQEQFARYLSILMDWNGRMNLTAVREPAAIETRHFLDSLTCAPLIGDLNGQRLIDVGTGAGLPGLPLKILYPEMQLTLVESVGKKTRFLQAVVDELALTDVIILQERAEALGQQHAYREKYDWAVARAVAKLPTLAEYLLPFCKVGGHMLAQKGRRAEEETAVSHHAITLLGGGAPELHPITLTDDGTTIILVEKIKRTPKMYPRHIGTPAKMPL